MAQQLALVKRAAVVEEVAEVDPHFALELAWDSLGGHELFHFRHLAACRTRCHPGWGRRRQGERAAMKSQWLVHLRLVAVLQHFTAPDHGANTADEHSKDHGANELREHGESHLSVRRGRDVPIADSG